MGSQQEGSGEVSVEIITILLFLFVINRNLVTFATISINTVI